MATNVKNLRLIGGEDVLGELLGETNDVITLKNPVRIVVVPSKADPKQPSIGFAPYCEWSSDKEVNIRKSLVVAVLTPVPEFINQYNSVFGGIQVPDSKLIIP